MRILILIVVLQLPLAVAAQLPTSDTLRRVDDLFSKWNNATPGVSVAIERNGAIIYQKAFGLADLEHNVPATTATIFEAGSVSKQFTAAAILLLVQEGKLSLDDDIHKYIPELPRYEAPVTIRQCMNHTSGLKDWGSVGALSGWPRTTRVYTLDLALQIMSRQQSLNFRPGSEYSYSNAGYSIMVAIVQRVSKMSLQEFTQKYLFEPAGMKHTEWRANFRKVLPSRAIAYRKTTDVYEQEMPFENVHGHGGLLTTTEDLIVWNHQLSNPTIGGQGLLKLRTEEGKLTNGNPMSYAGGLFLGKHNGYEEVTHTGATAAYRAVLSYYPEKKLSIAILSNDGSFNPGSYNSQIADIFLGEAPTPKPVDRPGVSLSAEAVKKWAGVYRSIRNFDAFTLRAKDNNLETNDHVVNVFHPDTLYLDHNYFIAKGKGQVLRKTSADTGTYIRVKPPLTSAEYLKSLTGTYQSDEADVTYYVELRDNKLWINNPPHGSYPLSPSYEDGFYDDDRQLYEFKRSKKGSITSFELSTSRAERIVFLKINKK